MNAVMAYMLADWYRPGVCLDFPRGGSGAIAAALVRAIEKHPGCRVLTRAHVEAIELSADGARATGVRLRGGGRVGAGTAVVRRAPARALHACCGPCEESFFLTVRS